MDATSRRLTVLGFYLLAVFLPLGLTLEALHALKVPVYLEDTLRRELWTLAHAHGNLLGIVCLLIGANGERLIREEQRRRFVARWLTVGAVTMPLGFLLGGVLNAEGDPSLFILLVPAGGLALLAALVRAAWGVKD
ncbi:MAG TPA: hypothetical protein EYQ74_07555 [Planctomycetes bacterium]|nr:hypothetical protein [Planctomycetota bacterium]